MAARKPPEASPPPFATTDIDPGPRIWGQVEFVDIIHPDIPGSRTSVPVTLVEHHAGNGWVLADSEGAPPDEEVTSSPDTEET